MGDPGALPPMDVNLARQLYQNEGVTKQDNAAYKALNKSSDDQAHASSAPSLKDHVLTVLAKLSDAGSSIKEGILKAANATANIFNKIFGKKESPFKLVTSQAEVYANNPADADKAASELENLADDMEKALFSNSNASNGPNASAPTDSKATIEKPAPNFKKEFEKIYDEFKGFIPKYSTATEKATGQDLENIKKAEKDLTSAIVAANKDQTPSSLDNMRTKLTTLKQAVSSADSNITKATKEAEISPLKQASSNYREEYDASSKKLSDSLQKIKAKPNGDTKSFQNAVNEYRKAAEAFLGEVKKADEDVDKYVNGNGPKVSEEAQNNAMQEMQQHMNVIKTAVAKMEELAK